MADEKKITNENKCKLISDCLESIAKCYYQKEDYQQVLKFKMLQVELQNEIEATALHSNLALTSTSNATDDIATPQSFIYKQKCKIWLDIGNLFLFKFNDAHEAFKYFEMVLKIALDTSDLLLHSLTLGNLGLCRQKNGEYESALDFFKEQLIVLNRKLKLCDELNVLNDLNKKPQHSTDIEKVLTESSSCSSENGESPSVSLSGKSSTSVDLLQESNNIVSSNKDIKFNYENIVKIKEIISIRIDMGRSYAKLGKCYELLSQQDSAESQFYLREALKYYDYYSKECFYLFENYAKSYFAKLEGKKSHKKRHSRNKKKKVNFEDDQLNEEENENEEDEEVEHEQVVAKNEDLFEEINFLMKDLSEQIYIDYDTSLAKLASFYFSFNLVIKNVNNLEKSIELNEKRLNLLNFSSKYILNKSYWLNLCIQINFMLANFYAKQFNTLTKSMQYCENIIQLYQEEYAGKKTPGSKLKEDIFLIETLNLLCDVSITYNKNTPNNLDSDTILNNAIKSYKLIWQYSKLNDTKILQLKYDTMCRLCAVYRRLKMAKECLEVLMDSLNRFMLEFQQLQQQEQQKVTENSHIKTNKASSESQENLSK